MALIKCPECGKEVSDKAAACIHCGYPINKAPSYLPSSIDSKELDREIQRGKLYSIRYIRSKTGTGMEGASSLLRRYMLDTGQSFSDGSVASEWKDTSQKLKCPKCGSTAITTGARGANGLLGFVGASRTVNRCGKCGYTWKP